MLSRASTNPVAHLQSAGAETGFCHTSGVGICSYYKKQKKKRLTVHSQVGGLLDTPDSLLARESLFSRHTQKHQDLTVHQVVSAGFQMALDFIKQTHSYRPQTLVSSLWSDRRQPAQAFRQSRASQLGRTTILLVDEPSICLLGRDVRLPTMI